MLIQQSHKAIRFRGTDIKKFQLLYFKHFNETLSDDQARMELTLLICQLEIVYRPITISQFDKYIEKTINEEPNNASLR